MGDTIKRMWVDRVPQFVDKQRKGIDAWPGTTKVVVTDLVDAYMELSDIIENGHVVGRTAEFFMKGEHMATLRYDESKGGRPRPLVQTIYHV